MNGLYKGKAPVKIEEVIWEGKRKQEHFVLR